MTSTDISLAVPLSQDFPSGLYQPEGCARFGTDALLLGSFAARVYCAHHPRPGRCVADLGCGVGAALFAFALTVPQVVGLGLDVSPELVHAARHNALRLGLGHRMQFLESDLTQPGGGDPALDAWDGSTYLAMANPPWYAHGAGRQSPAALKARAHSCPSPDFFCGAAARLLQHHGFFAVLVPSASLVSLVLATRAHGLGLRQLLPVVSKNHLGATRILALAQKGAKDDARFCPQLLLRDGNDSWSKDALAFCPWLAPAKPSLTGGQEG